MYPPLYQAVAMYLNIIILISQPQYRYALYVMGLEGCFCQPEFLKLIQENSNLKYLKSPIYAGNGLSVLYLFFLISHFQYTFFE